MDNDNYLRPLHLVAEGEFAILMVHDKGRWIEIIRERLDSPFSHIIEPAGILTSIKKHDL